MLDWEDSDGKQVQAEHVGPMQLQVPGLTEDPGPLHFAGSFCWITKSFNFCLLGKTFVVTYCSQMSLREDVQRLLKQLQEFHKRMVFA